MADTIVLVTRLAHVGAPDDPRNRAWVHNGTKWQRAKTFTLQAEVEQVEVTRDGTLGGRPDDFRKFIPGMKTYNLTIERVGDWKRYASHYVARGPVTVTKRPVDPYVRTYVVEGAHFASSETNWLDDVTDGDRP
jgi:hypothetical protein